MDLLEPFVVRLFKAGGIKVGGEYQTRHGPKHPIYIDMRVCMKDVELIKLLADLYLTTLKNHLPMDTFCGVPMGSIYLTSILAYQTNSAMIIPRPNGDFCGEPKDPHANNTCIVEDLVTTGTSLRKVQQQLHKKYRQQVSPTAEWYIYSICFLQYYNSCDDQGDFRVTTLCEVMAILERHHLITIDEAHKVYRFFHPLPALETDPEVVEEKNPLSLRLYDFKLAKKSRVVVALDVNTWEEAKEWLQKLYPWVIGFKFHFDILSNVNYRELFQLSCTCTFEIFRDRKYGDVAHINSKIQDTIENDEYPPMINIYHGFVDLENLAGPSIVVLEMSNDSCPLNNVDYRQQVMKKADDSNVIGYVSQHKWWTDSTKICFTPGVKTIEDVKQKKEQGADIIIAGRMILESDDPVKMCQDISQIMCE
uniref:Phosphoribosyl transferase n=1 Tax=Marseillevirus LCMAC101 TaxID=2506602 RepID=A0A481YTZ6_9VIRU|nr:MAG: phosphoribosyl transferase [Marseillevirus LCMAC101]